MCVLHPVWDCCTSSLRELRYNMLRQNEDECCAVQKLARYHAGLFACTKCVLERQAAKTRGGLLMPPVSFCSKCHKPSTQPS